MLKALSNSSHLLRSSQRPVNTSDYDPGVKWMGHMAHMGEKRNETTQKTYAYIGGKH
jgi:hypothetical protein